MSVEGFLVAALHGDMVMVRFVAAAGALMVALHPGSSPEAAELDRSDVETIVREYLNEHPEVIYEAVERHQQRLAEEARRQQDAAVEANFEAIVDGAPWAGASDADAVTVVEFLDYNCGYCKRSMEAVLEVLESESDVRFVFVEFPILAPSSRTAALAALAADRQGAYFELHRALMEHRGALTDRRVIEIAEAVDLDVPRLEADMKDAGLVAALERNAAMGESVGVQGTPFFLINRKAYPGWLDADKLRSAIAEARSG